MEMVIKFKLEDGFEGEIQVHPINEEDFHYEIVVVDYRDGRNLVFQRSITFIGAAEASVNALKEIYAYGLSKSDQWFS
ncbi:MAG: hypothetical protein ABIH88_02250 [Patescibacteria group bacterium]